MIQKENYSISQSEHLEPIFHKLYLTEENVQITTSLQKESVSAETIKFNHTFSKQNLTLPNSSTK